MITVGTYSDQNKQPEPPKRKPNEDSFAFQITQNESRNGDGSVVAAVVCDGIPVPRGKSRAYPPIQNGAAASACASSVILWHLTRNNFGTGTPAMKKGFEDANDHIRELNEWYRCYKKHEPHWIATLATALWFDSRSRTAIVGHIGDSVMLYLPNGEKPRIVTEDHLARWVIHHSAPGHPPCPGGGDGYEGERRLRQDLDVRNKLNARCWCGKKVHGWGGLTGKAVAMKFVEIKTFRTARAGRFIIASDAICVFAGNERVVRRTVAPYRTVLASVAGLTPENAARWIVNLTREKERETGARSDDATAVVIDFKCP